MAGRIARGNAAATPTVARARGSAGFTVRLPRRNGPSRTTKGEMSVQTKLVVIGNGMVGHRLLERLIAAGATQRWSVTVFSEEPRLAYDRVNLSKFFDGKSADDLALATPAQYAEAGITVVTNDRVVAIDRATRTVRAASGRELSYDRLVMATGSSPFVPPVKGREAPGCFV